MKKTTKILQPIIFLLLFVFLFVCISKMFSVNDSPSQMIIKGFFQEPKNSLDVALIGPSELYADYSASLAWKNYGYTSYPLTMGAAPGSLYKPMLQSVLNRQRPKLIVFSINSFIQGSSDFKDPIELHRFIDNVPWSENRKQFIRELIPKELQKQYYFNIIFSHVNWKRPISVAKNTAERLCMDAHSQSYTKGICSVSTIDGGSAIGQAVNINFDSECEKELRSLLTYCKDSSLKNILFVRFPHQRTFNNPEQMEYISSIIRDYGYDFLNLNDNSKELGISLQNDFSDPEHMNVYGMEKMTNHLGNYIVSNYDVISKKTPSEIKHWNNSIPHLETLITKCKEDIKQNNCRFYYEASIYWTPVLESSHSCILTK